MGVILALSKPVDPIDATGDRFYLTEYFEQVQQLRVSHKKKVQYNSR